MKEDFGINQIISKYALLKTPNQCTTHAWLGGFIDLERNI